MWRHYSIRAGGEVKSFYAPTLDNAFGQARGWKPTATQWECLGSTEG